MKSGDQRNLTETYTVEYETENGTNSIEFNLCGPAARQCPDLKDDYANFINANNTCNHLSRIVGEGERPGTVKLISEVNPELGLKMVY